MSERFKNGIDSFTNQNKTTKKSDNTAYTHAFFSFICKMGNYGFPLSFYLIIKRLVLHIQPVYRHRSEPSVHGAIVTERCPALGVTRRGER